MTQGVTKPGMFPSKEQVLKEVGYAWISTNTLFYLMYPQSPRWSTAKRKKCRRQIYIQLRKLEKKGSVESRREDYHHVEWRRK